MADSIVVFVRIILMLLLINQLTQVYECFIQMTPYLGISDSGSRLPLDMKKVRLTNAS